MVPISLTHNIPLSHCIVGFSRKPTSLSSQRTQLSLDPVQITGFRACSSTTLFSGSLNYSHGAVFKDLDGTRKGYRQLGVDQFRVLAVSDGGSGGSGGVGGSSGGGGEGSGASSDSGGSSNWSFLSWYLNLLANYPVLTKAVTSAILTLMGDLICQLVIDQVASLDLKRTVMFTLLGLVLVGPTLHFWYFYLSKLVTVPGASGALLRLLVDQFVFSPIFIGVFLSTLVTLEGRPSQVIPKLQQEWFSAVLANWQLWIPFQFLNFRFVPQQFQVLAANVIALVWNVILSFKAHKEVLPK
ncbi:PEROXISOMAL MEMBRANE PROTEIN 2 PXMP2 MPV17 [Salix koriyanagi]|uniref:PEROXISOMAL MEMBRANE PROTEIN 2 PXMP2 MPV17 n=2 Tax=Salix koriyanagi TaxID=2511006 RepID=A0A9Q0X4Q9_9ROSI|nr:PEROXISOMAL MEMBRANE PROTEIN 2 PXMP2 MPV17 [Salix koriyanagi]